MNRQFQMMQQNNMRNAMQRRAGQRRQEQARQAAARRRREADAARQRRIRQQQAAQSRMLGQVARGWKAKKRAAEAQRRAAATNQASLPVAAAAHGQYRHAVPVPDPYLLVESGPVTGAAFPIPESWADLGRHQATPYNLAGDAEMSRSHARIWVEAGVPAIADLGSTNGTFVNGQRISSPAWLQPGDIVQVGGSTLRVGSGR